MFRVDWEDKLVVKSLDNTSEKITSSVLGKGEWFLLTACSEIMWLSIYTFPFLQQSLMITSLSIIDLFFSSKRKIFIPVYLHWVWENTNNISFIPTHLSHTLFLFHVVLLPEPFPPLSSNPVLSFLLFIHFSTIASGLRMICFLIFTLIFLHIVWEKKMKPYIIFFNFRFF